MGGYQKTVGIDLSHFTVKFKWEMQSTIGNSLPGMRNRNEKKNKLQTENMFVI